MDPLAFLDHKELLVDPLVEMVDLDLLDPLEEMVDLDLLGNKDQLDPVDQLNHPVILAIFHNGFSVFCTT